LVYQLNALVSHPSLNNIELQNQKKEILDTYKQFNSYYKSLPKKSFVPAVIEKTQLKILGVESKKIYQVNVRSVKLKKDSDLIYLTAWLEGGNKVELIERINNN